MLPTKMSLSTPPDTSAAPASAYPVTICTRSAGAPAAPRHAPLTDAGKHPWAGAGCRPAKAIPNPNPFTKLMQVDLAATSMHVIAAGAL